MNQLIQYGRTSKALEFFDKSEFNNYCVKGTKVAFLKMKEILKDNNIKLVKKID